MLLSDPEHYDYHTMIVKMNPGGEDEGDDGGHIGDDDWCIYLKALC